MMILSNISKYSNNEKVLLSEKKCDGVSKKEIELSSEIKSELNDRLHILEEGKTELYSLEDVKKHIQKIRKNHF